MLTATSVSLGEHALPIPGLQHQLYNRRCTHAFSDSERTCMPKPWDLPKTSPAMSKKAWPCILSSGNAFTRLRHLATKQAMLFVDTTHMTHSSLASMYLFYQASHSFAIHLHSDSLPIHRASACLLTHKLQTDGCRVMEWAPSIVISARSRAQVSWNVLLWGPPTWKQSVP